MIHLRLRPAGLVLAAILVAGASYVAAGSTAPASRSTERGGAESGSTVAGSGATLVDSPGVADLAAIDLQIRVWAPKSAADARDDISAGNLAILYLGRGRLTGDAADYDRAAAAADRAVAANSTSPATRALKATVLVAVHDFPAARTLARAILAEDGTNVDALAVAGDAELELGNLDAARVAYGRIAALRPGPALDARLARLAWLSGDAPGAIASATKARDGAADDPASDPSFYEAQLGEIARLTGRTEIAGTAFDAALTIRPTSQLALLGRARLAAFAGDDAAAIRDLRAATAIAPRPESLGLLSDLLDRSGDTGGADRAAATIGVIARLGGTSGQLFDRQILLFELDHGPATRSLLDRATAAASVRSDAAGIDLVAWAAYRIGDLGRARAESERALATGTMDARALYHAGAIRIAGGDVAGGRALVADALALGAALDPGDRDAAEALFAGG